MRGQVDFGEQSNLLNELLLIIFIQSHEEADSYVNLNCLPEDGQNQMFLALLDIGGSYVHNVAANGFGASQSSKQKHLLSF